MSGSEAASKTAGTANSVGELLTDQQMNFRDLVDLLTATRWTLLGITAMALFLGVAYSLLVDRVYKADGMVQVEENQKGGSGSLGELSAVFLGSPEKTEGEIELLRSRLVLNPVIDALGLTVSAKPRRFPLIGAAIARWSTATAPVAVPAVLRRYGWGGEKITVPQLEVPPSLVNRKLTLRVTEKGYALFEPSGTSILQGLPDETAEGSYRGQKVVIKVTDLQALPGTEFKLVRYAREKVLNGILRNLSVGEQGRQSGVIRIDYYGESPQAVSRFVNELERSYLDQNVERRSADARKSLDFLNVQLPQQRERVQDAKARLVKYQQEHSAIDFNEEIKLQLTSAEALRTERRQLEQQRVQQLSLFTANSVNIKTLDDRISRIGAEEARLKSKTSGLPPTQQEYLLLLTDLNAETQLYAQMLNSIQEMKVATAGTVGNVRVVDEALDPADPYKPVSPDAALVVPLSLVIGLIAGVVYVLFRRLLLRGVDDPSELERYLRLPALASIPYSGEERRLSRLRGRGAPGLLALSDGDGIVAESIRGLRTALHFAALDAINNVIMFTGPTPGIGKSFVVSNLAAVLAQSGKRVVVIDADLRKGTLNRYFSTESKPGLSDFLAGDVVEAELIRNSGIVGLDVISRGTTPATPAELLLHARLKGLIESLSARYDHVLIDTPPILAVTDAAIIGRLSGTTLLVLKSATHPLREIEDALNRLVAARVKVSGAVMNQVGVQMGSYGYRSYGYKYYRYAE